MGLQRAVMVVLMAAVLAACGDEARERSRGTTVDGVADEPLPTPAGAPGSAVTGMPGARELPAEPTDAPPTEDPPLALDENGNPIPPDATTDPAAAPDTLVAPPVEGPGAQAAADVVRDFYGAINQGDFTRAYGLWSDGGRATGQSPQQFAEDLAQTRNVAVQIGPPGPVGSGSGARFVDVPVNVMITEQDGTQRRMSGTYTLRRPEGGGEEPWRIANARLQPQP